MKKWMLWVIYGIFHFTGIIFMALSIEHWRTAALAEELRTIIPCVFCFSVSLTIWYKYKLRTSIWGK